MSDRSRWDKARLRAGPDRIGMAPAGVSGAAPDGMAEGPFRQSDLYVDTPCRDAPPNLYSPTRYDQPNPAKLPPGPAERSVELKIGGADTNADPVPASGDAPATTAQRPRSPEARVSGNGARPLDPVGTYAALDLGTNNCRLLVAQPQQVNFRVIDAFSRIIRLGEGLGGSGRLSDDAMDRAVEALAICQRKMADRGVTRSRLIATEACRGADNGAQFVERVKTSLGMDLEIVDRRTEAQLAVAGCSALIGRDSDGVLLFDIGGGSTELVFLDFRGGRPRIVNEAVRHIRAWTSLPVGVVTLSERHGGVHVTRGVFESMVDEVRDMLSAFGARQLVAEAVQAGNVHMLGTSGTVTTLAGLHLRLPRYDRRRVDGTWLERETVTEIIEELVSLSFEERAANPCIGTERADLVLAGCAILEAIRREWPCQRLRVADRGLREGILVQLMMADRVWSNRRGRRRRGRRGVGGDGPCRTTPGHETR